MGEQTPSIPVDPNLATEQAQAQNDLVGGLQTQTQGDMASLMQRYGTQLAMSGAQTGPMVSNATGGIAAARAA